MARQIKKNNKNIVGMPCILGKVSLNNKIEVWKEYKENVLNEENEWSKELNVDKNE